MARPTQVWTMGWRVPRCAWTGGRSGGVAHRASAGWAAVLRPVPSPRRTTTVLWGGEGGPSAGALVQAAVRPGAVLRRLRAQVQPAARQHQARPLHPTTQSWSAVVRAPGASQQPTKRRRGLTHLHCGPQSTRSARHPPPHRPHLRGARHCGWRNGRNRGTREVFLQD